MSQPKEPVNTDMMGRVLSLEQRTKGLQGRIAALEARLSGAASSDLSPDPGIKEDVEFVAALPPSCLCPGQGAPDVPSPGPGSTMRPGSHDTRPVLSVLNSPDLTGIVAGAILIGAGLLLFTGNIDLIKNPSLSLGCGIFVILVTMLKSTIEKYLKEKL